MEQVISFHELMIEPYEVEQLLDVQITQQLNEHSRLYVKALLPEGKSDSYAVESREGTNVCLKVKSKDEGDEILFHGMLENVEISSIQGTYYMELYAVSHSYLLDVKKKSRTFQNKKMTYDQLIQQITSEYEAAKMADMVSQGKEIGQLIVQYEETDWEFLKRLASHFHVGICDDIHYDNPYAYFGKPDNGRVSIDCVNYSVKKNMSKFHELSQNGIDGLQEHDFVFYEVATGKRVSLGDEVQFREKKLYVCEVDARMEKGLLIYNATLTTQKGMTQRYSLHDKIAGVSLSANIVDIKNDTVKVSMEIDELAGHNPGELCFFPYSTIYSSQDGSGWYCMPEIGDHVRIYFPDGTEEHSYAISSVHEEVDNSQQSIAGNIDEKDDKSSSSGATSDSGGSYSGQRDDPSVKSLRNQSGKEIRLSPGGIYIIADGTTITLTDEGGVSIVSDQNIEFKSDKNIVLSAETDVNIVGLTGVDLSCSETASINLKDDVKVIGQEVKSN